MTVYRLNQTHRFPDPQNAESNGLLAVGGDLSPERLLAAYSSGVFPWPVEGLPLTWFSPDPRMVLHPTEAHISRSLRKELRRDTFRLSMDRAFPDVIRACANVPRSHETGTWITTEMQQAYTRLHELGFAHSVECWSDEGELVGGLYGISLGTVFCGESMFHYEDNASKVAFVSLAEQLARWEFDLIDCQLHTPHLERMGASTMPRDRFLGLLKSYMDKPTKRGRWSIDDDLWDHLKS
jgi:leucyl/phenylalanyl-tRNA--protein transferase